MDAFQIWTNVNLLGQVVAEIEEMVVIPTLFSAIGTIVWLTAFGMKEPERAKKARLVSYGLLAIALLFGAQYTVRMMDSTYPILIQSRKVSAAHWAVGIGPLLALGLFYGVDWFTKRQRRPQA